MKKLVVVLGFLVGTLCCVGSVSADTRALSSSGEKFTQNFTPNRSLSNDVKTENKIQRKYKFDKPIALKVIQGAEDRNGGFSQKLQIVEVDRERLKPQLKPVSPRGRFPGANINSKEVMKLAAPVAMNSECGGSQTITTTMLGAEITYGSFGPKIPVFGECRIDENPPEPLFPDAQYDPQDFQILPIGYEDGMDTADIGSFLTFSSEACYPNCDAPYFYMKIASDDPQNAIILMNGDVLQDVITAKGINPPFGGQLPISDVIADYMVDTDGDGIKDTVAIGANELIILYELGTTNPSSPAFDAQDAVLMVRTECDTQEEVVLRDSIGPDSSMTDFNDIYPASSSFDEVAWAVTVSNITPDQDVTLTSFRTVLTGIGFTVDWEAWDYRIKVWDVGADPASDPTCIQSTCTRYTFDVPAEGPTNFGETDVFLGTGITKEVVFDLTPFEISLTADEVRSIGFSVLTPGGSAGAGWMVESEEVAPSNSDERGSDSDGWMLTIDDPSSRHDGRLAVDIRGITQ